MKQNIKGSRITSYLLMKVNKTFMDQLFQVDMKRSKI